MLAACLTAAIDAEDGDVDAAQRLPSILDDPQRRNEVDIEVMTLDSLARSLATAHDIDTARDLLRRSTS